MKRKNLVKMRGKGGGYEGGIGEGRSSHPALGMDVVPGDPIRMRSSTVLSPAALQWVKISKRTRDALTSLLLFSH